MTHPTVSIIICTRNRARSLGKTLATIGRCDVPQDLPAELLVVDNGSHDNTRQVAESCDVLNMPVRYILEGRDGKGNAYNTGMAAAAGQILLFTDDDVRVPRDWIAAMCQPIARGDADATTGEIRIAPHLQPDWLTARHRPYLLEVGDLSKEHAASPFLIGANMAFHRRVLDKVPGFDVDLGPGALGFMDETLFCLQLHEAKFRVTFVAGCPVEHHFEEHRLTRAAQLRSAKAAARSHAWVMHHWAHEEVSWRRLRMLKNGLRLVVCRLRWIFGTGVGFDPDEVDYTWRVWDYRERGRLSRMERVYQRRGLKRAHSARREVVPGEFVARPSVDTL